jgi:hypothetical protein
LWLKTKKKLKVKRFETTVGHSFFFLFILNPRGEEEKGKKGRSGGGG